MKKLITIQNLAWLYCAMFVVLGSLRYIPWINDANGVTLGIFSLQWYDNVLHYASGIWAGIAAWRSFKDSTFYFKLFGLIYGFDGVLGFFTGQGYLDAGIFIYGYTPLSLAHRFFANIPHITIGSIAVFIGFYLSKRLTENVPA